MSERNRRRGGGRRGPAAVEKPKDFRKAFAQLFRYLGRYKVYLTVMFVCAVAGTVFTIVGPKILGNATTELFHGLVAKVQRTGSINFEKIGRILLTVLILYLVSALFSLLQGLVMAHISNDVSYQLRRNISEKINRIPVEYFESRPYGEVLSRVTNDVDTLQQGINQSITQLITSVTSIIGVFIMMLTISVRMTLAVVTMIPLSVLAVTLTMKRSQKYFKAQQRFLGEVNGQIEEVFAGENVIKAFNRQEASIEEFEEINDDLYESAWKSQAIAGLMRPLMIVIGHLGYVTAAVLGSIFAVKRIIEVGDIQALLQYVRNFSQPIQQIGEVMAMMQSATAASERVFEFLDEPEEEETGSTTVSARALSGNVSFDHIRFGYDTEQPVIHDFSAQVLNGQKVAIVGPTGAGKTTIVKLLMRFYDVQGGCIKIDGHNLKEFDRSDLRSMMGMVLQDTWLFAGTIMENIRYGKLDASDEEVIQAAKAAHVHHFIMQQPDGYHTVINEEMTNISQGQKQLLTIARAILADNKILILDEATSSVDTWTEIRIQKAMDRLMEGRTSFVIAHRLSTIRDADMILVMNHGDIVEQGCHQELLDAGGFYAELYNSQFEPETA